jgi:hypothetical protein
MRVINRRSRPSRWTDECTAILLELSGEGRPDQRIADEIQRRTGLRFHRNKVLQERRARLLGACWSFSLSARCVVP